MAEFVLKNNYFEFNVKHQLSSRTIEANLAPTYTCIFMDKIDTWERKT